MIELNRSRNNVVLSRRAVLEDERKEMRQAILDRLNPGDVVEGTISNIVDFGAFVDLDGMDGLIHISELSWSHVNHPSEVLDIGQTVKVKVLDIDRERQRISLGLKQTQSDPWQQVLDSYGESDVVEGRVTKVVTFGAFVEILPGVEGLVHISELANHHVENPREVVSQGDPVNVLILEIDGERRRLSLSLKRVEEGAVPVPRADGAESVHSTPDLKLSEEAFPSSASIVLEDDLELQADSEDEARSRPSSRCRRSRTSSPRSSRPTRCRASGLWTTSRWRPSTDEVASDPDEATKDAPEADDIPLAEAAEALNIDAPGDDDDAAPEPESDKQYVARRGRSRSRSPVGSGPVSRLRSRRFGHTAPRRSRATRSSTICSRPTTACARRSSPSSAADVLGADGRPDRANIAQAVFADRERLAWLEQLLHPLVSREYLEWREQLAALDEPPRVCVTEVPLLFEVGAEERFDRVVVITAPTALAGAAPPRRPRRP